MQARQGGRRQREETVEAGVVGEGGGAWTGDMAVERVENLGGRFLHWTPRIGETGGVNWTGERKVRLIRECRMNNV